MNSSQEPRNQSFTRVRSHDNDQEMNFNNIPTPAMGINSHTIRLNNIANNHGEVEILHDTNTSHTNAATPANLDKKIFNLKKAHRLKKICIILIIVH